MPDTPTPASPWMAGANSGPTVPGQDVTDPDAPDIGQSDVASNSPMPATQGSVGTPTKPGSLFRTLISSLGLALTRGAQAGLTAPRNAQGPAVAAETAQQAPQKEFEQRMANQKALTTADLDKMTVAMSQLKLHQLHTMVLQEDKDVQDAAYNKGRDTIKEFIDKGKIDVIATGDMGGLTAEWRRRQADADKNNQGLLPLKIYPAPGSTADKPEYILVNMAKGKLTEALADETWGASTFSDDPATQAAYKAAGLGEFKYKGAPANTDQQKAENDRLKSYQMWWTKSAAGINKYKEGEANRQLKGSEGQKNRDMRMSIAELQASTRRATTGIRPDQTDKEIISAGKTLIAANKALGDAQGKIGNKAWDVLGGGETREIATKRRARDEAEKNYNALLAKKGTSAAVSSVTNPTPAAVPKGTPATKAVVQQYLQKAGGDKAKARQALTNDGYVIPQG